jgi:hypothetical protein
VKDLWSSGVPPRVERQLIEKQKIVEREHFTVQDSSEVVLRRGNFLFSKFWELHSPSETVLGEIPVLSRRTG